MESGEFARLRRKSRSYILLEPELASTDIGSTTADDGSTTDNVAFTIAVTGSSGDDVGSSSADGSSKNRYPGVNTLNTVVSLNTSIEQNTELKS